ncbi:hypothetical protein Q763_09240 [Flavobacterium beibuense F44-8]|uniref:Uncharacterized protein n=1 Tax=Flavobacterium beibuense F44-8 TaxID=1406840 RepID=A0A0A2LPJ8_9FLAO|nr:hypothetical protein [Flavobacterium beibuense]KGO81256.1 hypothetical protein Q763_09240 [Flavobacterium beibuense F44-8]
MSRKIRTLFKNLRKEIVTDDLILKIVSDDYSIDLSTHKEWLTKSEIICSYECSPHKIVSIVKYLDDFFIVIPEDKECAVFDCADVSGNYLQTDLLFKEIDALKIFIWSQVPNYKNPHIDESDLLYNVFLQPEKNKFDISDLERFFLVFDIWKLDEACIDVSKLGANEYSKLLCFKLYSIYLLSNKELLSLNLSHNGLDEIIKSTLVLHGDLISMPFFRGLTSTNWEHLFLEFYRCIERLYGFPVVNSIISLISSTGDITCDFDLVIKDNERKYNLRPNEESALTSLLELSNCNPFVDSFAIKYDIQSEGKKVEKVASRIYKRRNSIAHWRKALEEDSLSVDAEFMSIITEIISQLYGVYGGFLRMVS